MRDDETMECRMLHNEELYKFYSSFNLDKLIKS